jgi:hypothetical protein
MLYTYSDIKGELLDDWDNLSEQRYPEDSLQEYADSAVPVYTSEIIQEWRDMPREFDNRWREISESIESIEDGMRLDLYLYYLETYHRAYAELCQDKEAEEE